LDFSNAAVLVLIGLVVLRGILIGVGAALILRAVPECPACFAPATFLLQRRWLRRLLPMVEWRFCPQCGWQGPSKRQPGDASVPRPVSKPEAQPFEEPGGPRY